MIFNHLTYHAAQRERRNLVIRGALTGVATHIIYKSILYRLLSLLIKKNF